MRAPAPGSWVDAIIAAGAVPAAYVPDASSGRSDIEEFTGAELVEGAELRTHALGDVRPAAFRTASFLDGIERWRVVSYAGVTPIVRAHVAAAVRVRGPDRRPRAVHEESRELAITRLEALTPAVREALTGSGVRVVEFAAEEAGQPARAIQAARSEVERARTALEQVLGERRAAELGPGEWLVVDGVLSDSAALSEHRRTLGVIKSHGAQFFEAPELERALTLPAGHRTSVFRPRRRGARREIYSWYLRLWPWEGNDLLYGMLRVEARADADTVTQASALSAWLVRERAPVSTPDPRWDRLLYSIHDVETYLKSRAPRDLIAPPASRLPRTGS